MGAPNTTRIAPTMSDQSQPAPGASPSADQNYDEEMANPPSARESAAIDANELKEGAHERSKQRPLLQKVLAVFRKEKGSYRELIINSEPLE